MDEDKIIYTIEAAISLATNENVGAFRYGIIDPGFDSLCVVLGNDGPYEGVIFHGVSLLQCGCLGHELILQGVIDTLVHKYSLYRYAALSDFWKY